jgi:hypothetical protein
MMAVTASRPGGPYSESESFEADLGRTVTFQLSETPVSDPARPGETVAQAQCSTAAAATEAAASEAPPGGPPPATFSLSIRDRLAVTGESGLIAAARARGG